ncbi:hypothetical protein AX16_001467 [Volvariella volvacea WC 439]|nr:hypothetical protein AX16_001467 [Volvariella volvacea WC 439]
MTADSSTFKFPHTRAQLLALSRQYKPLDSIDNDPDGDEMSRLPSSLVNEVVSLIADEKEDELKTLLKQTFDMDSDSLEQNVLDLMHRHRDDIAGVPFLFLTPTRRPISRPSSRASTNSARLHPARPDTPASNPGSPLTLVFRRPHTPVTSPLAGGIARSDSYMSARSDYSPSSSPILAHAQATQAHAQFTASLPASPLSSPRLLNARATEFKPIPRPLSAASSTPGIMTRSESPDLWAHSTSPRAPSKLAIAAPLIPDQSLLTRAATPSSLRSSVRPSDFDEENDPFNPFATEAVYNNVPNSDYDAQWSMASNSSRSPDEALYQDNQPPYTVPYGYMPPDSLVQYDGDMDMDPDTAALLTDGMTPFDVLSSVFGSSLAPSELEDALAANGFDFDKAMAWLVDRALPQAPQPAPQIRTQSMGNRVTLISGNGVVRGGRGFVFAPHRGTARFGNGRGAPGTNTRVCRYFVAGECLRADCRYSHDLERALCRFWLRGACAKHENCEFLHRLPQDVDMGQLSAAMARTSLQPNNGPMPQMHHAPLDEFPALGYESANVNRGRRNGTPYMDPGRTRFAAAVKKGAPAQNEYAPSRRDGMGPSSENLHHRSAIVAPRPSPRIKLRPATLLPTLPTGESVSNLYMAYRSRALQLGAARNACLSRAAHAWRRGDGAAAKRFSREGHDLNGKMAAEMAGAAGKLVRERAKVAEQAVRNRDAGWSDDPGDRSARGKVCGGGLGICLGIAGRGDGKLTAEERTECVLDLHGLHSNEATEVLEEFLLALEKEHFYGLAYVIVGEEKHTGTQDVARGASRNRLATGVREWIHKWGYPWSERDGIICVDPLTHLSE